MWKGQHYFIWGGEAPETLETLDRDPSKKSEESALRISGEKGIGEGVNSPWGRHVLGLSNNGEASKIEQNKEGGEWEMM